MSDKGRALIAFAKLLVALAAGGFLTYMWLDIRGEIDEWYIPYGAGLVVAVMVYVLLTRLSKSGPD